jgi:hypothetical protein
MAFGFLCWLENRDGTSMADVLAADGLGNAIMLLRFLVVYCTRKPVFFVSQHRPKAKMYLVSELSSVEVVPLPFLTSVGLWKNPMYGI